MAAALLASACSGAGATETNLTSTSTVPTSTAHTPTPTVSPSTTAAISSHNWSRIPHREVFGGTGTQAMWSLTTGGPGFVAVGFDRSDAAAWISPDGITLVQNPPQRRSLRRNEHPGDVGPGGRGPGLVAVGIDDSGDDEDARRLNSSLTRSTVGAMTRSDPPLIGPERESLIAWLQYHRETLAVKCADLDPAQLCERSVPPSTQSLIGLVRHMAEVERSWFRRLLAGESDDTAGPIYYSDSNPDGDFDDVDPTTVGKAMATWRLERERADEIVAGLDLDETRVHPQRGPISVRWVLTHMIEEYARHNGHADLLRERIDGVTGD